MSQGQRADLFLLMSLQLERLRVSLKGNLVAIEKSVLPENSRDTFRLSKSYHYLYGFLVGHLRLRSALVVPILVNALPQYH
jgi:hypothetical protein